MALFCQLGRAENCWNRKRCERRTHVVQQGYTCTWCTCMYARGGILTTYLQHPVAEPRPGKQGQQLHSSLRDVTVLSVDHVTFKLVLGPGPPRLGFSGRSGWRDWGWTHWSFERVRKRDKLPPPVMTSFLVYRWRSQYWGTTFPPTSTLTF